MNPDSWTSSTAARIEWTKVLDDIAHLLGEPLPQNEDQRAPLSVHKLADYLEAPRGTLRGWLDGSEPRHSDGERILAHWCRLTGRARTFVPVDRYVFSAAKAGTVKQRRDSEPSEHGEAADELRAALRTSRAIESAR